MKTVLIATQVDDEHALAVDYVLSQRGQRVIRWYGANFPHRQTIAVSLCSDRLETIQVQDDSEAISFDSIDTVWFRRPCGPVQDEKQFHLADLEAAKLENQEFYRSVVGIIAPLATWINHSDAARNAECKLVQLSLARRCGLSIPDTLSTNNPSMIRSFIAENNPSETIFKPFFPARWFQADGYAIAATAILNNRTLPSDHAIRRTAGIYQKRVAKSFEVRATFFGSFCIAAKINSQSNSRGLLDWRSIPFWENHIEPFELPKQILSACQALLQSLGLMFGCIDLIVTPSGDYVFLEVNQQGQFLWKEHICPELPMLETMCQFLIAPTWEFTPRFHYGRAEVKAIVREPDYAKLVKQDSDNHQESFHPARGRNHMRQTANTNA